MGDYPPGGPDDTWEETETGEPREPPGNPYNSLLEGFKRVKGWINIAASEGLHERERNKLVNAVWGLGCGSLSDLPPPNQRTAQEQRTARLITQLQDMVDEEMTHDDLYGMLGSVREEIWESLIDWQKTIDSLLLELDDGYAGKVKQQARLFTLACKGASSGYYLSQEPSPLDIPSPRHTPLQAARRWKNHILPKLNEFHATLQEAILSGGHSKYHTPGTLAARHVLQCPVCGKQRR